MAVPFIITARPPLPISATRRGAPVHPYRFVVAGAMSDEELAVRVLDALAWHCEGWSPGTNTDPLRLAKCNHRLAGLCRFSRSLYGYGCWCVCHETGWKP